MDQPKNALNAPQTEDLPESPIRFGTGGWRERIGETFTRANVELVAAALAAKMKAEGHGDEPLIIGFDRRFLSDVAAYWFACQLAACGIRSEVIKRQAPTPLVMYTVLRDSRPYGIAVTASHNPALYNGIKVFIAGGRDADEETTADLEYHIRLRVAADDVPPPLSEEEAFERGFIKNIYPFNDYIDSIINQIDMEKIRAGKLHVVLDPMYGVSKTSLQTILMTARCEVDVIHDRHDTLFGGRLPAPNMKTLNALSSFVLENDCDIGIATDGDADRIGVIDDTGRFLHPNQLLVLLYYYLLKYKGWRGPVVRNNSTTHLLDELAARFGEKCYEVPVGFKHISSKMLETDAIIGGESSGGLTVRGHIAGKDGIYAACLLVEMIAVVGKPLSAIYEEITEQFPPCHMEETAFRFHPDAKAAIQKLLMVDRALPEFPWPIREVSYLDGCKVYFENNGWINARFSGTEPVLRIFCELGNQEEAVQAVQIFRDFLGLSKEA
ncbi:MAG: phosphoglucomutase/phosphomannomutase family protein [Bacillota bacterium]|nr:phosphoglucomutase/phosphomannomutase family protein [Bacillota bacterium]